MNNNWPPNQPQQPRQPQRPWQQGNIQPQWQQQSPQQPYYQQTDSWGPMNPQPPRKKRRWGMILGITGGVGLLALLLTGLLWPGWMLGHGDDEESTSFVDNFTEEELAAYKDNVEDHFSGHSRPFREEPIPGIVVSAKANAFDQDTEVKISEVSDRQFEWISRAVEGNRTHEHVLFALKVNAGLSPDSVIPGKYKMEFDLNKMGIPEELHKYVQLNRIDDVGRLYTYSTRLKDGVISFESSQNGFLSATIGIYGYIGLSGLAWAAWNFNRNYPIANYFKDKDNAVLLYLKDEFGDFRVGFNMSDTEDEARKATYLAKLDSIDRQINKLEHDMELSWKERKYSSTVTFTSWLKSWLKSDQQQLKAKEIEAKAKILDDMLEDDKFLQRMRKDPDAQPPASVQYIIKMTRIALRFLRTNQKTQLPSYMFDILLVGSDYSEMKGKSVEGMRIHNTGHKDYIAINYSNMVKFKEGSKSRREIKKDVIDLMSTTITHELFHICQSEYTTVYAIQNDMRYMEATAAVLEQQFAEWLMKEKKISYNPLEEMGKESNRFGFTTRQHKEWTAATLTKPISSMDKPYEISMREVESAITDYMNQVQNVSPDSIAQRQKLFKEYNSRISNAWNEKAEDANVDGGYALADFIQLLMDSKGRKTCGQLMDHFGKMKGFDGSLKSAFNIKDNDVFYKYYEQFCLKYIDQIVQKQNDAYMDSSGKKFFYHLFGPQLEITPTQCVHKIQRFGEAGPYACRTIDIMCKSDKPYNMFLLPSEDIDEKAVKVSFMKNDSTLADNPYFIEKDKVTGKSYYQVRAPIFFTPSVKGQTFTSESAITAVALFAPENPLKVVGPSADGTGLTILPNNTAPEDLVRNNVLSGMQILIKNAKGDSLYTGQLIAEDLSREITIPWERMGATAEEAKDLKLSCRWYYRSPYDYNKFYYSPETTEAAFTADEEKAPKPKKGVVLDKVFKVTYMIDMDWSDEVLAEAAKVGFNMREASAHVTMNTDGTFTIDIAGQDIPISGGDEKSRGSGIYKISSISIQGKGTFYGDTSADPSSGVVEYSISDIDPASIKQSSIFKESELSGTEYCDLCERNEKKYEYTSHQFKIVDPEGKYSRSYTLNFVYRKDSEKETFSVGFWAHLTGVEKEEYVSHSGEDMGKTQKNTKDVDRELRIDFMGEIAK